MLTAIINKIISPSFIDGPGSRMVIFFQGCNMHCLYCHNPETQQYCNNCSKCIEVCTTGALKLMNNQIEYTAALCCSCDKCIPACLYNSSPRINQFTVDELVTKVLAQAPYIDGITLSGGECSLQYEFILKFSARVKTKTALTVLIDTNGYMPEDVLKKLSKVADGFIFDLKNYNLLKHFKLTGVDNGQIIRNIEYVSRQGLLYEVRTVVVESFTDEEREITKIANFINKLNDYTKYCLLPFRPDGVKTVLRQWLPIRQRRYGELCAAAKVVLGDRVIEMAL